MSSLEIPAGFLSPLTFTHKSENKMGWELINGITGIVSAVCAVIGIGYFGFHKDTPVEKTTLLSMHKLMSFVVACSGWALCCLSFLWITEPYGCCPLPSDYQQFFGVILGFPAIVVFMFGLGLLLAPERNKSVHPSADAPAD